MTNYDKFTKKGVEGQKNKIFAVFIALEGTDGK